jgi:hypothetical protein
MEKKENLNLLNERKLGAITQQEKKQIKEKIRWFEVNTSGLSQISGGFADCRNRQYRYNEKRIGIKCDIVSGIYGERKEIFTDCEYFFARNPIRMIKKTEYETLQ